MEVAPIRHLQSSQCIDYELEKEIREFEESKAGVKGLVDSGIVKIPRIFYNSPSICTAGLAQLELPTIDFSGYGSNNYPEMIHQAREATENWGFFRIVNHGIPLDIMEEILDASREFHEQPTQVKRMLYTLDRNQRVRLASNTLLRASKHGDWRDSLICEYYDGLLDPQAIPLVCRKAISNYVEHIMKLKEKLSQLLSAALGLNANYLSSIECMSSANLACNYYPACPEPDLTMGATNHSDPMFLTILLQDNVGGLQVLHQNDWVDVQPLRGALIVNLGDLMQLITNDKLKSVEHRVLVKKKEARTSVACFFYPSSNNRSKPYGPIQELQILENKPAIYKEISVAGYMEYYSSKGLDGTSALPHFKAE